VDGINDTDVVAIRDGCQGLANARESFAETLAPVRGDQDQAFSALI
jgi:hypothetical protein